MLSVVMKDFAPASRAIANAATHPAAGHLRSSWQEDVLDSQYGRIMEECPFPFRLKSHRWPMMRGGFTLVETLIVVAIMAVLLSLICAAVAKAGRAADYTAALNDCDRSICR